MKLKINLRQYSIDAVLIEGILYVNTEQAARIVGGAPPALLEKEFIGLEELSSLLEDQFKRGNRGAINFYEGLLNDVAYNQVYDVIDYLESNGGWNIEE